MQHHLARSRYRRPHKKLIAWARWQLSAGPGTHDGEPPLWDTTNCSPTIGESYCRESCAPERRANARCADCPAPTLLPENEPVLWAYLACCTQWRTGPNGRTGLDYGACRAPVKALRKRLRADPTAPQLPPWDELLGDLQTIEHAILACDSEHRAREDARRESERQNR